MRVTKLILRNCDRFLLNQIKEVVYTPDSPYQLITGNNGSGKSSLLEEISPLPPDKNKFTKNGYKEIHIDHEGKKYILKNDFTKSSSGHHSFLCDGVELNYGANVTTQLLLVKEHFHYTKDIHELVTGRKTFTNMTGLQRRDWFIRISNVDMEYIMDLFDRVKTARRDNQGAIKLQEKRLASSIEKLPSDERQQTLQKETDDYKLILDKLDSLLPKEFEKIEAVEARLQRLFDKVNQQQHLDTPFTNKFKATSLEGLKLDFENTTSMVKYRKEEFERNRTQLKEVEERLNKLQWNDELTDEMIEKELQEITDTLSHMKCNYHPHFDIEGAIDKLLTIKQPFEMWCAECPSNQEGCFNQEAYQQASQKEEQLLMKRSKVLTGIKNLQTTIAHINENKFECQCPRCENRFMTAVGMDKLPTYEARCEEGNKLIEQLDKELQEIQTYLTDARAWRDSVNYAKRTFILPYPELVFFFDSLGNFFNSPLQVVGKVDKVIKDLEDVRTYRKLEARQLELIELLKRRKGTDGIKLKGALETLSDTLSRLQHEIKQFEAEEREREHNYKLAEQELSFYETILKAAEDFEAELISLGNALQFTFLHEVEEEYLREYRLAYDTLQDIKTQRRVIEDIKQYLHELKMRETSYKMLIDILNPNDGLIAKTLLGFIHHFLEQFNQLIGHIWSYGMKVVADESSDFTKNYNFPLKQANKDTPSNDVRESSKGQREMVDFAFLMLVMRYLGLEHFPLLLDELGGGFTETHRIHILNYLKQMVETGQIEQMFLVSHNPSSHDTLNLADVICFDLNNVLQDERLNRVIKFS